MKHILVHRTLRASSTLLLGALLAAPSLAQLPFDLVELSVEGHPDNPGIDFQRHPISIFSAEGGGMAVVDVDNDGWLDVFFSDTEGHPNHLYLNNGDGSFTESAAAFGIDETVRRRGSAVFFDMENDGDMDLLSCGYPSQAIPSFDYYSLFRNDGAPNYAFTEVTSSAGGFQLAFTPEPTIIGEPGGATTGDVNGDGYLDAFITYWNRSDGYFFDQPRLWISHPNPKPAGGDLTFHSERAFVDESIEANLIDPIVGWVWTPTLRDVDLDGDLDLMINIDQGFDILRLNDGTGVFGEDVATPAGMNGSPADTRSEMGIAMGDVNFDRRPEDYRTNANFDDRFLMNESDYAKSPVQANFKDVGLTNGTNGSDFGWGTVFADMDNDLDLDLLAVCGMTVGYENHYYENRWPELDPLSPVGEGSVPQPLFVERTVELPDFRMPGGQPDTGRNLAVFDFDRDGDLDLVVGRPGENGVLDAGIRPKASLFRNDSTDLGHWLQVDLIERAGSRNVIGARVIVRTGETIQQRTLYGLGTSFLTQMPDRQHFGLGEAASADWIAVRWFDGVHTVYPSTGADQLVTLERAQQDYTGDMNGDGLVDLEDRELLGVAIRRPTVLDQQFAHWPWQILGDIDGNTVLDARDVALLEALIAGSGD